MLTTNYYQPTTTHTTHHTREVEVQTPYGVYIIEVGYTTHEWVETCNTNWGVQTLYRTKYVLENVNVLWGGDNDTQPGGIYLQRLNQWWFNYLNNNPMLWAPQP